MRGLTLKELNVRSRRVIRKSLLKNRKVSRKKKKKEGMERILSACATKERVDLCEVRWPGDGEMINALLANDALRTLSLDRCFFEEDSWTCLCQALSAKPGIEIEMVCEDYNLLELAKCSPLTSLRLSGTFWMEYDTAFFFQIAEVVRALARLQRLELANFSVISPQSLILLADAVNSSSVSSVTFELCEFDSGNDLTAERALGCLACLKELRIFHCSTAHAFLASLVKDVGENVSLVHLALSRTEFDAANCEALANSLRMNSFLKELDLSKSRLNLQEAEAIADAMRINRSLSLLRASFCEFSEQTLMKLAEALRVNTSLKELHLDGNFVSRKVFADFGDALAVNKTLLILSLGSVRSEGGDDFVEMLAKSNGNLLTLAVPSAVRMSHAFRQAKFAHARAREKSGFNVRPMLEGSTTEQVLCSPCRRIWYCRLLG